jgi:hypothetical protein
VGYLTTDRTTSATAAAWSSVQQVEHVLFGGAQQGDLGAWPNHLPALALRLVGTAVLAEDGAKLLRLGIGAR